MRSLRSVPPNDLVFRIYLGFGFTAASGAVVTSPSGDTTANLGTGSSSACDCPTYEHIEHRLEKPRYTSHRPFVSKLGFAI